MFCKWCGKKITNIGSPCPSCGKDQDPLENGNGFWDLCSKEVAVQPVSAEMPAAPSAKESGAAKTSKKNKNVRSSEVRKPAKKLWVGAWAVTVALLLIAIIVIIFSVGKIDLCLSEISSLRSSVYSTNTLVTNGFAKLEEYHLSEEEPETQVPEETEPVTDENTPIDLDRLIEENTLLMDDEALNIDIYMIESMPAKCVYIAGGEMLKNENAKVFWQKSIDQGETWETICDGVSYIIVEANETDVYRIICVVPDDSEVVTLYCDATIELEENTEPQSSDAKTDADLTTEDATDPTDADETQPTDTLDKKKDDDPDDGDDNTTTPSEPEDGSVG